MEGTFFKELKMSVKSNEETKLGNCPICDVLIEYAVDVEEAEILVCPECHSSLVVESVRGQNLIFNEAPQVDEDWGE